MNKSVSLLIHSGRIIDPGRGMDKVGDLLIDEGRIVQLGGSIPTTIAGSSAAIVTDSPSSVIASRSSEGSEEAAKQSLVIDATGLIVCPGFVDLHCHLREPGFEDKETIATGTRAAAAGGFTTVCCMANTNPPIDSVAVVERVKQKASEGGFVNVLPIGCITRGRRGEELCAMAELARSGVVAFSDDGDTVMDSQVMRAAMDSACALGLPVIDHCEDKALSKGGVVNEGKASAGLGVKGIPAAAEEIMVARDIVLAKLTGAKLHVAHVSTCGSVELIRRAKEEGIPVTAEVTPHHLTLTEERIMGSEPDLSLRASLSLCHCEERKRRSNLNPLAYDTNAKVNPPLRTKEDVECLIEGLKSGVIDAIATDHAPHTLADKECELELATFGISGFETAFGCLMSLVHKGEIGLDTLISRLTCGPAKIIGRDNELGTLKVGIPASITIVDPEGEWVVDRGKFVSKGKNTPFDGCQFKGKIMATIVNGRVAYVDDSLAITSSTLPFVIERSALPFVIARSEATWQSNG